MFLRKNRDAVAYAVRIIEKVCVVGSFAVITGFTGGCLSPVYDTARIYKGLTVGAGLAYHDMSHTGGDIDFISSGIRSDLCISYALMNWFGVVGHAGVLFDKSGGGAYPFAGIGCKFSTVWNVVNLALRVELEFPRIASLTPMVGFSIPGAWEIATLGVSTSYLIIPATFFVNVHPLKGSHLFAGIALPDNDGTPEICLGIGYTYTFDLSGENKRR